MKHIITFILFASPFIINAQEPVNQNKGTKTPPATEKSISEKGVSSTKGRGISTKKTAGTEKPVMNSNTDAKKSEEMQNTKQQSPTTTPQ